MKRLILANAARLEALHTAIHEAVRTRHAGPVEWKAWEDACSAFHDAYDSLAWPGGLQAGFIGLRKGEPKAVEAAVTFLEADPIYFRSGYHKVEVVRALKRVHLHANHTERLRDVVLERIRGPDRREFRAYCQLAGAVSDSAFESAVSALAAEADARTSRHARWVLDAIRQHDRSSKGAT